MKNYTIVGIFVGGLVVGGTLGFGAGMQKGPKSATAVTSQNSSAPASCSVNGEASSLPTEVLVIKDKKFTEDELPSDVRSALYESQHESYEKTSMLLKEFALRYSLASEKTPDVKIDGLPALETLLPTSTPDDVTVKSFYEANKSQLPPGTTYEQVKPQIVRYLANQQVSKDVQDKIAALEKAGTMKVNLKEPVAPIVKLDLEAFPSEGPKTASLTLVETSDYLCPHCQQIEPQIAALRKEFEGKIRFVQVNFALNPAGLNGLLAQGAYCAQKQSNDAFWKFHGEAFHANRFTPAADFSKETLAIAQKAGVLNDAFQKCLTSDEAKNFVADSIKKMSAAGVTGTPTFFLNGRKIGNPGTLKEAVASALKTGNTL